LRDGVSTNDLIKEFDAVHSLEILYALCDDEAIVALSPAQNSDAKKSKLSKTNFQRKNQQTQKGAH